MNLILAAVESELKHIDSCQTAAVGIGMLEAAVNTCRVLDSNPDTSLVIFVGSCGVSSDLELLKCYFSQKASLYNDGYRPDQMVSTWSSSKSLVVPTVERVEQVYSSNFITTSKTADEGLVENMEAAGVAAACCSKGVPWCILTCATNFLGPDASSEWQKNHVDAAEITSKSLESASSTLKL